MTTRPAFANLDNMLIFLDALKADGNVGFGITEQVERQFKLSPQEAVSVICYWLATYGTDGPR